MATSERDGLRATLDARGVDYDKRWGVERLRQLVAETEPEADDEAVTAEPSAAPEAPGDAEHDEAPAALAPAPEPEPESEPVSEWPKRIAPAVWLHEDGSRTWA